MTLRQGDGLMIGDDDDAVSDRAHCRGSGRFPHVANGLSTAGRRIGSGGDDCLDMTRLCDRGQGLKESAVRRGVFEDSAKLPAEVLTQFVEFCLAGLQLGHVGGCIEHEDDIAHDLGSQHRGMASQSREKPDDADTKCLDAVNGPVDGARELLNLGDDVIGHWRRLSGITGDTAMSHATGRHELRDLAATCSARSLR